MRYVKIIEDLIVAEPSCAGLEPTPTGAVLESTSAVLESIGTVLEPQAPVASARACPTDRFLSSAHPCKNNPSLVFKSKVIFHSHYKITYFHTAEIS